MLFRRAVRADLPDILALLADDLLGQARDTPVVDEVYEKAWADIDGDPRNLLVVGVDGEEVVACLQVTFIPGLGRHGAERALVESVRVRADRRGGGVGAQLMAWVIQLARQRGCALMQLTTDKRRGDAHRFYARLGFVASHEGMKLSLS